MAERTVVIGSAQGLHARPARIFVQEAARQPVPVHIGADGGKPVPAASILAVLALGARQGDVVTLSAPDGEEGQRALDELAALIERDLDTEEPEPENA